MAAKKPSKTSTAKKQIGKSALKRVKGGGAAQSVTVNKAKTADKAYAAMDAYIKQ